MSRRVLAFALVLGLGISGGVMTVPREAQCAACPTYTCFGPCGGDCACMKEGLDTGGTCVSFERADALERAGWLRVR